MPSRGVAWRSLLQARLSRRIVLWVFSSIVLIEAIILLPSIHRRHEELLSHMRDLSQAKVEGGLGVINPNISDAVLLKKVEQIALSSVMTGEMLDGTGNQLTSGASVVLGGSLYDMDGQLVGSFGEVPQLSFEQVQRNPRADFQSWRNSRYDAVWSMTPLKSKYILIIRHDASLVLPGLLTFTGRIAGLVIIISLFVTIATLIGLEELLITPIMVLRQDLLKAGKGILNDGGEPPTFDSLTMQRQDELGDVISAFDQMYQQVSEAIAERKQAEAALRQSEEKFAKAFRSSPNPILISRLADGQILEVNDSFLNLYGGTLEDVLGQSSVDLNLWADPIHRAEMIGQLRQQGALRNLEYNFRTKTGEPKTILFSTELINLNGQECLVSVANDITERKQAEKALSRLAELGEFAAMIVHEVRNPLTTVLMGLESFRQMELSERFQMRLNFALEEADRLQRLLNEILQYARCQKLQSTKLEVSALIMEMLEAIRAMPAAQGREIKFMPTAEPVVILGDRDKLRQVFINLLSNACEAVSQGETVTWSVESCTHRREACIRIHNGGEPIPPDVLSKLSQPFYTTKPSGNGLGLAVVKRIIEAHKGELLIESSSETGTIVTVILPLAQ